MNKKNIKFILIVAVVVVVMGVIWYRGSISDESVSTKTSSEEGGAEQIKQELMSEYNAVDLIDGEFNYTLDIQTYVGEKRNFLLQGYIEDIVKVEDNFYVQVNSPFSFNDYYSTLLIDGALVDNIIDSEGRGFWDEYLIIATIDEVTKPIFEVSGFGSDEEWGVDLDLDSSDAFLLKGEVIDLRNVEEVLF